MRDKNKKTNKNVVKAGLISPDKMLKLLGNVFSRHKNKLECLPCEKAAMHWKYGITPGGLKYLKRGRCMRKTTGKCVITLMTKQLGEE